MSNYFTRQEGVDQKASSYFVWLIKTAEFLASVRLIKFSPAARTACRDL